MKRSIQSNSRLALIALALTGLSLQSGCSSHRLRDGIWQLSFNAQRGQNRLELPIDSSEVRLLVEWNDAGDGEIVEIASLDGSLKPMYGDIEVKSEDEIVIKIDHQDDDWHWRMWGRIRDDEHVTGEMFYASARQYEDLTIEGRWGLRWLRDG